MVYCLPLPRDAVQLIEEMRCHWKDLAELKAAGGTPAARLIKTITVELGREGICCAVRPRYEGEVYFRVYTPRPWLRKRRRNLHGYMSENFLDFDSGITLW